MECRDYKVHWYVQTLSANYSGEEIVWASSVQSAAERTVNIVNRKTLLAKSLIKIESINLA